MPPPRGPGRKIVVEWPDPAVGPRRAGTHVITTCLVTTSSLFACLMTVLLASCEPAVARPPQNPWAVLPPGRLVGPPPPAAAPAIYTADEAVRDALASPLQLVGAGGWYGYFRHLSCIYRNAAVIVVDVRCNKRETYQFETVIYSPIRGRIDIVADASQNAPLSTVARASYENFAVSGGGPWAGPTQLTPAMSYDEITTYDELRSHKYPGECALTTRRPQGVCSAGAPFALPEFVAANAGFFQAPTNEWYQLVRVLVAERPRSYAATDLGKVQVGQLRAWGAALGFDNSVDVTEEMLAFVGEREKFAAVVATDDGGIAYVGTRRGAQVVVARTDRAGRTKWESALPEPGIREEGDTSLVASRDGFIVHAQGYVDPTLKAHHRLVKLDAHGRVQWKWFAPILDAVKMPQFFRAQLTPQGTVLIDGYIQLEKDGPVHGWTAEVSADGKTLRTEVGSVELGRRNGMP